MFQNESKVIAEFEINIDISYLIVFAYPLLQMTNPVLRLSSVVALLMTME
jgi:hypothetical protein